tara:strand:- start:1882 stop:2460 length:579 start_codon:yes stop_codon:yes gene_type:complete
MNREEYLTKAAKLLNSQVFKQHGYEVPKDVKISCSWSPSGNAGQKARTLGTCFPRALSKAGVNEINISPSLDDSIRVLDVLTHELIHAIDDCKSGHKGLFRKIAVAVGLEGKMTATVAGEELTEQLEAISKKLGKYPHAQVDLSNRKKQTVRNIKVACNSCEFSFRTSRANISKMHIWNCPACCASELIPEL